MSLSEKCHSIFTRDFVGESVRRRGEKLPNYDDTDLMNGMNRVKLFVS
jgi:hypothetical protein